MTRGRPAGEPSREREIVIRPLREDDLPAADRIVRLAFGTFLGAPDPLAIWRGRDYVRTRWLADPAAAFGAELDGELIGSNFAAHWGSVAFFGPLTVHPDSWDRGVGKRLLEPVMECFSRWEVKHAGLFTFPHSPKHIHLYEKFGFWPRFLTALMSKPVTRTEPAPQSSRYAELPADRQETQLHLCRALTGAIYEGLDVSGEIRAIATQRLGDTVLLWDDARLAGLAACHCGPGTEAGDNECYVKFGAVRPGPDAAENFDRLLDACEALAAARGLSRLTAGVNVGRPEAYRQMMARGFRTDWTGVTMHRPDEPGYNRPGVYLIDDWR